SEDEREQTTQETTRSSLAVSDQRRPERSGETPPRERLR
ncbi:MAG: hypothetical protein ACI9BK_003193, partial [Acidimicrobiales bacterium]